MIHKIALSLLLTAVAIYFPTISVHSYHEKGTRFTTWCLFISALLFALTFVWFGGYPRQ